MGLWYKGMGQGHGTGEGACDYGTRAWYKAWVKRLRLKDKGQGIGQGHLCRGMGQGMR